MIIIIFIIIIVVWNGAWTSARRSWSYFSANLAKDETCLFELALCVRHSMDRGDRPLVLSLHHLASHHMRPSMLAVLKTTDYIQWDVRDDVAASCWGRLRLALQDVMAPH